MLIWLLLDSDLLWSWRIMSAQTYSCPVDKCKFRTGRVEAAVAAALLLIHNQDQHVEKIQPRRHSVPKVERPRIGRGSSEETWIIFRTRQREEDTPLPQMPSALQQGRRVWGGPLWGDDRPEMPSSKKQLTFKFLCCVLLILYYWFWKSVLPLFEDLLLT